MTVRSWHISRARARPGAGPRRYGEGRWPGVVDVVLAYRSVAVFGDPEQADLIELESRLRGVEAATLPGTAGRRVVIPVLYDGADLDDVAARLKLPRSEVIAIHSSVDFDVFAVGFLPGFPYAGYLPPALAGLPRRDSPRLRVPAGSVAITGVRRRSIRANRRGMASAGDNAAVHRGCRLRLFPDSGRRPHPLPTDLRRGIRGQTS